MQAFLLCLFMALSSALFAGLPKDERVPGGVAVIPLPELTSKPTVYYLEKPAAVVHHGNAWHAVVGIPLTTTPGSQTLTILDKAQHATKTVAFSITEKNYPTQAIRFHRKKVKPGKPNLSLLARLEREKELLNFHFDQFTQHHLDPDFFLKLPVQGRFSGNFGLRRTYDGVAGGSHKGIDVAAPKGTPIHAAQAGKVVLTQHLLLTGKTVLIDHGQGFVTAYCHLNHIKVKEGQMVSVKDTIGTVGKTGRSTGPHLHFGVSLNGTRVNPALFM